MLSDNGLSIILVKFSKTENENYSVCRAHHKKKKERKVREKKYSSSQSADEESDQEKAYPGMLLLYCYFFIALGHTFLKIMTKL